MGMAMVRKDRKLLVSGIIIPDRSFGCSAQLARATKIPDWSNFRFHFLNGLMARWAALER
jgi:hypothetical protein